MSTPQLNIKDAETSALVKELAALTGESQTEAVRKAVKERLERAKSKAPTPRSGEHRRIEAERILANIQKIQDGVRKRMRPEDFLTDDDLYDEFGLPK
jgi:antitoxin VapB